jgi:hypothetical protein
MKIFQVKYSEGKYCYYKEPSMELVNKETIFYATYPDCKEEINPIGLFETMKVRDSLINYFKNDNSRT